MTGMEAPVLLSSLRGAALAEALLRALGSGPLSRDLVEAAAPAMGEVVAADVIAAVDTLIAEAMGKGDSLDGLKSQVSKLLNLLHRGLEAGVKELHDPLSSLLNLETRLALSALDALRPAIVALSQSSEGLDSSLRKTAFGDLRAGIAGFAQIEVHYARLENVLFPHFEARYPKYRCLALMWSIHDDVRSSLRSLAALARDESPDLAALQAAAGRLFFDVTGLAFREEKILFPVAMALLSPAELLALYREARALGPGLLGLAELAMLHARAEGFAAALERFKAIAACRPASGGEAAAGLDPAGSAPTAAESRDQAASLPEPAISLDSGAMRPAALDALLKRLPLDLTFIDAAGKVAYFSNGPSRVFPRSLAVIGRDVRNCHPPESLGRVTGLIEDFRAGRREREAFWIDLGGRFVHIEYFALRGPGGEFLGVLEASEDLTEKRSLEGEKRLADGPSGEDPRRAAPKG